MSNEWPTLYIPHHTAPRLPVMLSNTTNVHTGSLGGRESETLCVFREFVSSESFHAKTGCMGGRDLYSVHIVILHV